VNRSEKYVQDGYRVVVDVDLSKFFDRVNPDILIDRLKKRVPDPGVIGLVRAYLNAGIMDGGVVVERAVGTTLLRRLYDKLHLKINESKSAVVNAFGRKFLGYELWMFRQREVKRAVSKRALETFKQRIRQFTRRNGGRSIEQTIEGLRSYVLGWKAYYGLTQTPRIWRELDEWMRHRVRAIHLKHWRRGSTIYRELVNLGAKPKVAQLVAANSRRWWRNSALALNNVLTIAYFDRLGMPRLS
jgi:RNA-directed DNA polymerase